MNPNNTPEPGDSIEKYLRRLSERMSSLSPGEREEVEREVRAHLELLVADGLAQGLTQEQAIEAALGQFGNPSRLARAMNARGVTWFDYAIQGVAVAAWSAALAFLALVFMAGASGLLFGTLMRWGKTTNEIMPVAHFMGKILPVVPLVVAIVSVLLGVLGILPGTAKTSRHQKTLSWRATSLWLLAPCAALMAIVSALHILEIGLGRSGVSPNGLVFGLFSLWLGAPYLRAWRKRRLQKN